MAEGRASGRAGACVIRAPILEGIPHGFLTGAGHAIPPAGDLIVPGAVLVSARQIHSARALAVSAPFGDGPLPEADALATASPGLVLGIVTADCAPVLLADAERGVVGAAHAGWRGAMAGVLEAVVEQMVALGARRGAIVAAIGPAIARQSYEVDSAFRDCVILADRTGIDLFTPGRAGHFQFDLPAYVGRRLMVGARIAGCADLGIDTYGDPARFHSFRRATHLAQPTYGRQYSLIACPHRG